MKMTKKQKKALRRLQSTRQLMGIDRLTDHGVITASGELVFFLVNPSNLSVLSPEGVRDRVRSLAGLLRGVNAMELLTLNSRESFQPNRDYYRQRMEREPLPAVRELLRRDAEHLSALQSAASSVREFALVFLLDRKISDVTTHLGQLEKFIRDRGFQVRLAGRQDIMRLLAVYYQQNVTTEFYEDVDGERRVKDCA